MPSVLVPPRRGRAGALSRLIRSVPCSMRCTGRLRPIPGGGSTRCRTRSAAGTSCGARGPRCAGITVRRASTRSPWLASRSTASLLGELASELEEGRYRPLPARRVLSPSRARLRVSRGHCPFLRSALSPDEFGLISLYGITVAPRAGKPWRDKPNAGVNGVGEPWAGEPHARFEAAGAGNGAPGHGHRSEAARRGNPGKSGCGT